MGGRINYEEELRKANEELDRLRKQKAESIRKISKVVSPQVPAGVDVIRRQVEQLRTMVENPNQQNVNLEPRMGMVSRLKKGLKVITAFDEYELVEKVGEGACGKVFSAKNAEGEEFAIKFLDRSIGKTKLKRFKNEIGFCEHNNHPNVVKVLDHGCLSLDGNTYVFCVMPRYFESLRDKINKTIRPEDVIAIFVGLLSGLKFAHEKDVVHRDIKPENIMFAKGSNEPVICDFGIAHFSENDLMTFVETKPTDRLANFAYAAPEQRKRGGVAVPQTDLFSAGLILNEMFTKSVPQGSGYRSIKDVAPNYGFLDKIVEQLYRNEPQERLSPEDKIISEMKVLAELEKNQKEVERLRAIVKETTLPEAIDLKVVNKKYENSSIVFVMSQDVPPIWFSFLAHGEYGHESVLGYDTGNLSFDGKRKISMPLHDLPSEETIKSIVKHFHEWVPIINADYTAWIKRSAKEEQEERERQRRLEIARIEKENKIRQVVEQL